MSPTAVRTTALPHRWFERRQYRPRVAVDGGRSWFLLSGVVERLESLPEAPSVAADPPSATRGARLAEVLHLTYRDWDLPLSDAARRNLEALPEPDTLVVVTGQQPGFLTGPLYTIYKTLSAIALAATIERRWKRRCVPLFWVAGEDHDLDEIREARFPGNQKNEVVFRLPHAAERRPLSTLTVDGATESVLAEAREFFRARRYGDLVAELIDLYRGRNLASGFAAILSRLFGDRGLLFLDPEKLRPLAMPLVKRLILEPEDALERIESGRRQLEGRGLRPFVAPRLPLFILRDGRRDHLSTVPGGLRVDGDGPSFERQELLDLLETSPERFSGGALLRPIIQEALVPAAATVGGATEVGYHGQLRPLAAWFGVEVPRVALRLQATLIEGKVERWWRRLGLSAEKLAGAEGPEDLIPAAPPTPALEEATALETRAREVLARLVEERPPGTARRRLEKHISQAVASMAAVVARVEKERRRAQQQESEAASSLWHHVLPHDTLQERRWGVFYYLAKYGSQWLDALIEGLQSAPLDLEHKLVFFEKEA